MPLARFEPTIPTNERLQSHSVDSAAFGNGSKYRTNLKYFNTLFQSLSGNTESLYSIIFINQDVCTSTSFTIILDTMTTWAYRKDGINLKNLEVV